MPTTGLEQVYFRQARSCFFRWADDGNVLVWDNGHTIAFRAELAAIMKRMNSGYMPPLNAIAVLLSACRDNWPSARSFLSMMAGEESNDTSNIQCDLQVSEGIPFAEWLLAELDRINDFSADIRSDLNARCELAVMVFEVSRRREQVNVSAASAKDHANRIATGLRPSEESQGGLQELIDRNRTGYLPNKNHGDSTPNVIPNPSEYVRQETLALLDDLRWMRDGLPLVTEEALRLRLKTGVEDHVRPAEQEDSAQQARSLMDSLPDDEELGGVVRLARDLQALLTFPRQLSQPEDLPLGGISDITNRGQLDRLLLSELAHDDLTLATRIALNEALYLQRESPPAARSQHRRVFIDTGLCMWGVPRIFATSVGLSIAAAAQKGDKVEFFRPGDGKPEPTDLSTREGVVGHLETLNADLHPGTSLRPFFHEPPEGAEFVIVTHHDVATDREFRQTLSRELPENPTWLVSVDHTGKLTLSAVSHYGSRVVRSGLLNLEQILNPPKNRLPLTSGEHELPLILYQKEFPLRLSHQADCERGFQTARGVIMCTGDGRLLLWDKPGIGARQLTDKLGKGKVVWYGSDPYGVPIVVYGRRRQSGLKLIRVHDDDYVSVTPLQYSGTAGQVSSFGGRVFVEFSDRWEMFRSGHSECVSSFEKAQFWPGHQTIVSSAGLSAAARFVTRVWPQQGSVEWFATAESSGEFELRKVPLDNPEDVTALFDRRGQGIVAVYRNGEIRRLYGDESILRGVDGRRWHLSAVAPDGSSFILTDRTRNHSRLINTDTFGAQVVYGPPFAAFNSVTNQNVHSLRKKFSSITFGGRSFCLRASSGICLSVDTDRGIWMSRSEKQPKGREKTFRPAESPKDCEYNLQVASWNCGSRVYLDSRGLLHLKSHDSRVPQITLVLHEGRMSGWCESSGGFGVAYCMPDGNGTSPSNDEQVFVETIQEFAKCLDTN